MGRANSEPEGARIARARLRSNLKRFWSSGVARRDLWPSILNEDVEEHREDGSKSPKVSGKLWLLVKVLLILAALAFVGVVLAWFGVIPNFKT